MALLFVSLLPRFVPAGVECQVGRPTPSADVASMTFGWSSLHALESD